MRSNSDNLADSTPTSQQPSPQPPVVDIHCHCLPGVDDGPENMQLALDLCREMVADGISYAIATPHQLGAYDKRNLPIEVREITKQLNHQLAAHEIELTVVPGGEVRIDSRIAELLDSDCILTLADMRRHLLLELPGEPVMDLKPVINLLSKRGITPIIAHPERTRSLRNQMDLLRSWADLGAAFQINAPSLLGKGRPGDRDMARAMVDAGLVDLIASDCHNTVHRRPALTAVRQLLLERGGYSLVRRICLENPLAVLNGQPISTRQSLAFTGARS